ncbi:MAG: hypothetical protein FWH33_04055 [Oscillospiraceae bacterium]|nr:hypothetical protein [Oscillospiraceae bacterium]
MSYQVISRLMFDGIGIVAGGAVVAVAVVAVAVVAVAVVRRRGRPAVTP